MTINNNKLVEAKRVYKRQVYLFNTSMHSILWKMQTVQELEQVGEVNLPNTMSELIEKLEQLVLEMTVVLEAWRALQDHLSLS
jgi:uncharacterized membrane protein YgaE (UPF0421/DUF939 family)